MGKVEMDYDKQEFCWWSDLRKIECGHCLGQCDTSGAVIE